jgi:hypothetical protein
VVKSIAAGAPRRILKQRRPEGATLSPEHCRDHIEASSISAPVAEGRSYWTATRRAQLEGLVKKYQRAVPALVIPTFSPDGVTTSLQVRPNRPRVRNGKAIKYETPADSKCILDVHPSMHAAAPDTSRTLWITEGIKKGDSLTSRGECSVSLTGVWNWQRDGEPLPCWEHVALEDREVLVAFDSDVMVKPEVQQALERLVAFLEGRGAKVLVVYLSDAPDGSKVGVDDYLADGGTVAEMWLIARRYKRAELGTVRLSRDERLAAATKDLWRRWRAMRRVKQSECTDSCTARELIKRAERGGRVLEDGVGVEASVRTLALAIGVSTGGQLTSLRRLEESGFLRPDNEDRPRDKAARYVLLTEYAQSKQDGKGTGTAGGTGEDRESLAQPPSDRGVYSARPSDTGVPELRWSRLIVAWERDKRGRRHYVFDPLTRLGKKRQAILEHMVEAGGVSTVRQLMAHFASERTRPYDFKRRILQMLADAAIIVIEGEDVSLAGRWLEALENDRERAQEPGDSRRQAQKYARQREAYRSREERPADEVPEMTPIPDMRTPWPVHPHDCACPSCEKIMGRVIGEHVEDCRCADCFTARKAEDAERVVSLPRRMSSRNDKATGAASVAVLHEAPAEDPPDDWREHPLDCECVRCSSPETRYATPRSAS